MLALIVLKINPKTVPFKQITEEEGDRFVGRTIRHFQTDEFASHDVLMEKALHLKITQVV